ncbi:hypothetical protein Tco_0798406 [Tanacetum coccineum]
MQTPIPTPPRSFRNYLSLDKATFVELTDNHDTISVVLRTNDLPRIWKKSNDALHVAVPKISISATNDHLKDTFLKIISQDLATRVPKMFEDLFKQHMQSITSNGEFQDKFETGRKKTKKQKSTIGSSSANVTTSSTLTSSKSKVVHKPRTYATQPPILAYDETWSKVHDINDGVNILEEAKTKFIAGIEGTKWVPNTANFDKMKSSHNNILKSHYKTRAKHGILKISLSAQNKELVALLEEEIKERLKYRDQTRRWESFVNGRKLTNYMVHPE